jgi:outer membrane autotransporter protein
MGNVSSRLALMRSQDTGLAAGDEAGRGIQAWVQPFGSFLNQDAKEGLDSFSMSTYGVTLGGDTLLTPDLRVGLALTLSNSDVTYNGFTSGSKSSTFSVQLGLYGVYYIQNFFVDGLLSFGHNKYTSHTPLTAFGVTRDAEYGGTQLGAKIGAGYDIKFSNAMVLTPYASVQQLHLNFDSYTTSGAFPFNMHVAGQSADITQTSLGGRLAYPMKLSIGTLTPEVHVNWFHNFGADRLTTTYTTADVSTPGAFTFIGPHGDRDTFNIGVSANLARSGAWTFGAGYDFAGRSSSSQHLFYLRAKYSF